MFSVLSGPIRFGPIRFGPVRFGPVRLGSVRFDSIRLGSVRSLGPQLATLIGLCLRVKLLRSLPARFKVVVRIAPGTHSSEDAGELPETKYSYS